MKKLIVILTVYVVGLLLTYGRNYHEFLAEQNKRWPLLYNKGDAAIEAMASGVAWPIYWPFRLSREAFEPKLEDTSRNGAKAQGGGR